MTYSKKTQGPSEQTEPTRRKRVIVWICIALTAFVVLIVLHSYDPPVRPTFSPTRADLRSLSTGLEAYFTDHQAYPAWSADPDENVYGPLVKNEPAFRGQPTFMSQSGTRRIQIVTSPVAYITEYFSDAFAPHPEAPFSYWVTEKGDGWIAWSPGPDRDYDLSIHNIAKAYDGPTTRSSSLLVELTFDPTNGMESSGDFCRFKQ